MKPTAYLLILLAGTLFIGKPAMAQMYYKELEHITIGTETPNPNYSITANGFDLMMLYGTGAALGVSTGHSYCYIMGTNMGVCFYDAYLNKYNNIRALYVLRRANGEIYDDWVAPQSASTSILQSLRPVTYKLHDTEAASSQTSSSDLNIGFISQEVQQVLPKAVVTDPNGNQLVNYTALTPVAVRAIVQLHERALQNDQRLQQLSNLLDK